MAVLSLDGRDLRRRVPEAAVANYLLAEVNSHAIAAAADGLVFHSAAVSTSAGAVLLVGEPNAGKSTMVTGLVAAGLAYVTDEAVPVDLGSNVVTAYPKPIGLDLGSWDLFADLVPPSFDPLVEQRWWLRPDDVGPTARRREPGPPAHRRHRDHPARRATGPTIGVPITGTAEIVVALVPHTFNLPQLGSVGLESGGAAGRHGSVSPPPP